MMSREMIAAFILVCFGVLMIGIGFRGGMPGSRLPRWVYFLGGFSMLVLPAAYLVLLSLV